jgi:hypothetical protein
LENENNIKQERRLDTKKMKIIKKNNCKYIELIISKSVNFNKIIKCFTKNKGIYIKINNYIILTNY